MDLIANLATGFAVSLTPANLGFCFMGALIGTLVGVLPGIAPITTIAILLPFTFSLPPSSSLIMLAGIFYGAQYGGSTTAILVNVPGESSSIVTCLDGHQMAKQGRAGPALAIAAIASFVAGTIATIVMATASAPMTWLALKFNAAEYFSLMVLGLTGSVVLAHGAPEKAVAMVLVGLLLGLVGIDVNSGSPRMTMDLMDLGDGVGFVPIAIGMFGIAELAVTLGKPQDRGLLTVKLRDLWPSWVEIRQCIPAMLRGTTLGSVLGVLPGGGAALSSFAAYALEKKMSKTPERFGRGAIEGVAAPEAANNAGAQTSFIPLLTLGIPGNAIMALADSRAAWDVPRGLSVDKSKKTGKAYFAELQELAENNLEEAKSALIELFLFGWRTPMETKQTKATEKVSMGEGRQVTVLTKDSLAHPDVVGDCGVEWAFLEALAHAALGQGN